MLLHQQLTLSTCHGQVTLHRLPEREQATAHHLTQFGYLVIEPCAADQGADVVTFVSRIHLEYARFCFYDGNYITPPQLLTSISEFLRLVLQQMSSGRMAASVHVGSGASRGLSEARHQNEFYRYSGYDGYTTPQELHACNITL